MVKITHIFNKFGDIKAYVAWDTVDSHGKYKSKGEYLFIYDMYICKKYRKQIFVIFKEIIPRIRLGCKNARYIYWLRHKYGDRMKTFNINKIWRYENKEKH